MHEEDLLPHVLGTPYEAVVRSSLAVKTSRAYAVYWQLRNVDDTWGVFRGNTREVALGLQDFERQLLAHLPRPRANHGLLDPYSRELNRRLHNLLASAKSLVDHTRRVVQRPEYEQTPLLLDYNERVADAFINDPSNRFFQALRNFALHRGLPPLSGEVTRDLSTDEQRVSVTLESKELRQWDGWPAHAKRFLSFNDPDQDVALRPVLQRYEASVTAFNNWFVEAYQDHHIQDFAEFDRLVRTHNDLVQDLDPDGQRPTPTFLL